MLKKSITYENPFTELKVTEDFYFHISKADLVKMEVEEHKEAYTANDGQHYTGMMAKLQRIVDSEDGKAMMPTFEDIIRRSYGRKDGDRFMKSEEIWADFKGSGAFDELLFELCTSAEAAAEFVNGTMPSNLEQIAAEVAAEQKAKAAKKAPAKKKAAAKKKATEATVPFESSERNVEINEATVEKPVVLTQEEMVDMEPEELQTGLASGKFKLTA